MSTSILDYVFRELAISYLGRNDLVHVEPADVRFDSLGRGEGQADLDTKDYDESVEDERVNLAMGMASTGYLRTNLYVLNGGDRLSDEQVLAGRSGGNGGLAAAATRPVTDARSAASTDFGRVQAARVRGYVGDPCGECGNFTMVRNGTCMKCETCGGTSGCS